MADNLTAFLSILLDKHDMPPGRCANVTGVIVRIARPYEAVVRHLVPFFAGDFARFAADADSWVSEEANLDTIVHIGVPALIRAVCAFADHDSAPGERERLARSIARLAQCTGDSEMPADCFSARRRKERA